MAHRTVRRLGLASISLALVTGCGSQGSSPGVPAMLQQTQHSPATEGGRQIYVAVPPTEYKGAGSIIGFAGDAVGNVGPVARISGKNTGLGIASTSIAIDKLGRLYAPGSGFSLNSVFIWRPGSSGNGEPTATISGIICGNFTEYPMVLTIDRADHLWVACSGETDPEGRRGGAIVEFPKLRADFAGTVNALFFASRNILGPYPGFDGAASIAVKPSGDVSMESPNGRKTILTFAQTATRYEAALSQLGGNKTQLDGLGGIAYNSQNQLVACTNRDNKPRLLTFAAGAQGNVAPISTLSVAACKGITIDARDNVYVSSANAITEYAAGAAGSAQPIRVISGSLTGLTNATSIAFKN